MDIARAPAKRGRKQLIYGGLTVGAIVLALFGPNTRQARLEQTKTGVETQPPVRAHIRGE